VHAFRLPHALHIGHPFSRFSGISSTRSSLGFGIPLLLRGILLVFQMLILLAVGLTEIALLVLVIFFDLLLFAGLIENNLQLLNPP
jgi:type IV secretory pathway VirB3-like protein